MFTRIYLKVEKYILPFYCYFLLLTCLLSRSDCKIKLKKDKERKCERKQKRKETPERAVMDLRVLLEKHVKVQMALLQDGMKGFYSFLY